MRKSAAIEAQQLIVYESPFTDVSPKAPGLFTSAQIDELVAVRLKVREMAVAA